MEPSTSSTIRDVDRIHTPPIFWLPNELLAAILEHVVQDAEDLLLCLPRPITASEPERLCRALDRTLVVVTAVCARWRFVALSQSGMWTVLHGAVTTFGYRENGDERILIRFRRSGSRPLTVFDTPRLGSIHAFLIQHNALERVRKLHVRVAQSSFDNHFWDIPLPCLQELNIEYTANWGLDVQTIQHLLATHSNVKCLALQRLRPYASHPTIVLLKELRELTLVHMDPQSVGIVTTMISAPKLDTIRFKSETWIIKPRRVPTLPQDFRFLRFPINTIHGLRKLIFGQHDYVRHIIKEVPNVRVLQFTYPGTQNFSFQEILDVLLERDRHGGVTIAPHLETISIHGIHIQWSGLQALLDARTKPPAPSLTRLEMSSVSIMEAKEFATRPLVVPSGVEISTWQPPFV